MGLFISAYVLFICIPCLLRLYTLNFSSVFIKGPSLLHGAIAYYLLLTCVQNVKGISEFCVCVLMGCMCPLKFVV